MIVIVGAGGFALECFEVAHANGVAKSELLFFDDVTETINPVLEQNELICIRSEKDLLEQFPNGFDFILGIGNPKVRKKMYQRFIAYGGNPISLIADSVKTGVLSTTINAGNCIMSNTIITSNCVIEQGCLINLAVTIGHDSMIGEFVEICPGVNISGKCTIEKGAFIGTGAVLLPGITIGENAIVAAGAIVTKDVLPNTLVAGNPAVFKKELV